MEFVTEVNTHPLTRPLSIISTCLRTQIPAIESSLLPLFPRSPQYQSLTTASARSINPVILDSIPHLPPIFPTPLAPSRVFRSPLPHVRKIHHTLPTMTTTEFHGFAKETWGRTAFGKQYIMAGLAVQSPREQKSMWRNWTSWAEPLVREVGLLEPEDRTDRGYRTTNAQKSKNIVEQWRRRFSNDLESRGATDEWLNRAGQGVVSYIIAQKRERPTIEPRSGGGPARLIAAGPLQLEPAAVEPSSSSRSPSVSLDPAAPFQMPTAPPDSAAPITLRPERTISELGLVIARGQPDGQWWQPYSAFSLQRPGLDKRPADVEVVDLSLTRLVELLKEDGLMKESGEVLVAGAMDAPWSVTLDRHLHDWVFHLLGQRRSEIRLWIRVPAEESVTTDCMFFFHFTIVVTGLTL